MFDIVDALLTAQFYVGLNPANFNQNNADVNCDGSVDIVDALLIAQYYVGLIAEFCWIKWMKHLTPLQLDINKV